jgi:hypothetical protein
VAVTRIDILEDRRAVADGICYVPPDDSALTGDCTVPMIDSAPPLGARAALAFHSRFAVLQAVGAADIKLYDRTAN